MAGAVAKTVLFAGTGAAIVAAGVYVITGSAAVGLFSPRTGGSPIAASDAARRLRTTLDPDLFQGGIRQAYEVAAQDPALLVQLHCYCGCDRTDNHKNLLDCFRDTHGAHCDICVAEAREAELMARRGMSIEAIRDALRMRYSREE